jgi:hypothetical protein
MADGKRARSTRNALLRGLHRGYIELLAELHRADEVRAEAVADESGWSLRDHVAHLANWEALELARAEGRSGLPEHWTMLVEVLWHRRRGRSLPEALERFAAVHRRLVGVLTDLPEVRLVSMWSPGYPDSLAENIARNTYVHYSEHLPAVRGLVASSLEAPWPRSTWSPRPSATSRT